MTELFNPFPGLRPFRQEEHFLFFGREEQTAELLELLGEPGWHLGGVGVDDVALVVVVDARASTGHQIGCVE